MQSVESVVSSHGAMGNGDVPGFGCILRVRGEPPTPARHVQFLEHTTQRSQVHNKAEFNLTEIRRHTTPPIGYAMWAGLPGTAELCLRTCTTSRRRNAVVVGRVLDYRKDIKHQRLTRVPTSGYPSSAHRFKMAWAATSRSAESTGCLSRSTNSSAIL